MAATIAALSSGRLPAGIAVIRISGPQAFDAARRLAGRLPAARSMALRALRSPDGDLLDRALVVSFPGPASATGEDLVELHLHGGVAVVEAVLRTLLGQPDVRLAEPGEFTRRGFANGRIDLAEAEGIADLVAAESDAQRRQALALAGGGLSRAAEAWRERCLMVLAEAEAGLDFAEDEGDVAARIDEAARETLAAMATELSALIADAGRAARIRDGLSIAVTGPPNVGKSSLVNALAMRDAAIVTHIAGTTRDVIEVPVDLDGVAAILIDTAGLRDTEDPIEAEGIRRARSRAAAADLVLVVDDSGVPPEADTDSRWHIRNKIDLAPAAASAAGVSAVTNAGIAALRARLARWAATLVRPGEPALLAHTRHLQAFATAAESLREAAEAPDSVLRAEGLRAAAQAFARISGRIDVDDVLDRIFSRFCIGK